MPKHPQKLREAKIIFPLRTNAGRSLENVLASITDRLHKAYGGVTWVQGRGAWRDDDGKLYVESNVIFTVAVPETEGAIGNEDCELCRIARFAMAAGEHTALYVKFPDGEVQILQAEHVLPDDYYEHLAAEDARAAE